MALVGCGDPVPGSTVNASPDELPRPFNVAFVDGKTAVVPMVPADVGPLAPSSHI
jgi:hypothetical protein